MSTLLMMKWRFESWIVVDLSNENSYNGLVLSSDVGQEIIRRKMGFFDIVGNRRRVGTDANAFIAVIGKHHMYYPFELIKEFIVNSHIEIDKYIIKVGYIN
jgi:hypothetical protein